MQTDTAAQQEKIAPTGKERMRQWIITHDDSWLFVAAYIGLAVALSFFISLFWLVAVVAVHGAFEWIRHGTMDTCPSSPRWTRVLWELKLDIALILFAVALAVYLDVVLGVAGLGGAARLGVQAGSRAGSRASVLARSARGVLMSLDDAAMVGKAAVRKGDCDCAEEQAPCQQPPPWRARWQTVDKLALFFLGFFILVIIISPALTHNDGTTLLELFAEEFHPFPWWG